MYPSKLRESAVIVLSRYAAIAYLPIATRPQDTSIAVILPDIAGHPRNGFTSPSFAPPFHAQIHATPFSSPAMTKRPNPPSRDCKIDVGGGGSSPSGGDEEFGVMIGEAMVADKAGSGRGVTDIGGAGCKNALTVVSEAFCEVTKVRLVDVVSPSAEMVTSYLANDGAWW